MTADIQTVTAKAVHHPNCTAQGLEQLHWHECHRMIHPFGWPQNRKCWARCPLKRYYELDPYPGHHCFVAIYDLV